jgi:glycosyltransferase involved in cell wall biosynthesis
MRIGVDLAPLNSPLTGVGNYTFYLLEALLRAPDAPAIEGLEGLKWRPVRHDYFAEKRPRIGALLRRAPGFGIARQSHTLRRIYAAVRRNASAARGAKQSISLFHAFAYVPPCELLVPTIPVVYDLSFVRFPELHPPARLRALEELGKHIRSAPMIHTISHFSAKEIADVYGVAASQIAVISPGVKPIFLLPTYDSPAVLARYELTKDQYFLVISTLEPRKNLRTLVSAYSQVPQNLRAVFPLCIVGGEGWNELNLPSEVSALEKEGSLRFLGFVPDSDLRSLYEHARAMMYPSIYEGFGMPIIEALAAGTPVVCSNSTSMPEAGGSAARTVAPLDVDGWTKELLRATDVSSSEQKTMRLAHAAQFTWERAARQTIELYAKVLAG